MNKTQPQADPLTLRALAKIADHVNYLYWAMAQQKGGDAKFARFMQEAEVLASELRQVAEVIERD